MKYDDFIKSDTFRNYVNNVSAWKSLPPAKRAEVASTAANILGVELDT